MEIRNPGSQGGSTLEEASMRAGSATGRITERAQQAVGQISSRVHDVADRLGSEDWMAQRDELMESTRSYVREHPMMALGIAAGVGFLLSRMLR
jgi:ElaB/YqjD/DUF883 family membrane-anchored ribosome-binding protein